MWNSVTVPRFQALTAWERGNFAIFKPHRGLRLWLLVKSPQIRISNFGQTHATAYHPPHPVNLPELTAPDEILPRVAAGEARAMDLCISRYGAIVWAIAKRYIKDTSEAEDLVQEVFTEIWKKAASFDRAIASESTFVGLIARRRAIDFLRRQGRQPGFEPLTAAESLPLPTSESCSITCDPETVKSSLANLPSDTRQLFHLFFENGFTHPEIAERTGLPLGTVKTRLRRGLITLREQLQRIGISNSQAAS